MSAEDAGQNSDPARERIVEAFTERAGLLGPRSVVMAELATELGISTRTLYRHFRSKSDLMTEVITRFAEDATKKQESRFARNLKPRERILETAYGWLDDRARFSAVFWKEAHQQYPEAVAVWRATQRVLLATARERVLLDLREDLPPDLALSLLFAAIDHAADPRRCDRLGLSRQEAVTHAAEVWARGALRRPVLRVVGEEG
ncbi:MAG: TetR/AcrR family transcriptional regulator [Deltaproteobacteria bacterium]|nr:TetR/AcrR family transcriptional regulator [Deltaproteobacteria bacterium]MBW2447640.1 TetR/AcrR family transcriptional regulator [Deltaproteobacteria bacterium]